MLKFCALSGKTVEMRVLEGEEYDGLNETNCRKFDRQNSQLIFRKDGRSGWFGRGFGMSGQLAESRWEKL